MTALEKFQELPHINSRYEIQEDWAYTPNLYHFEGEWHVSWIFCIQNVMGLDDFSGSTPEEAIDKAYEWFHNKFKNN